MLTWSPLIFVLLMTPVCGMALVLGGWEARVLGGLYMAACLLSLAAEHQPWSGPQWAITAIDAAYLAVSIAVVGRSTKAWPILVAAMQLLTIGAHLAFVLAKGRLGVDGYLTVLALWSYGIVGCLAHGLARSSPIAVLRRGVP